MPNSDQILEKHLEYLMEYHQLALNVLTRLEKEEVDALLPQFNRLEAMALLFPEMEKECIQLKEPVRSNIFDRLERQNKINHGIIESIKKKCQTELGKVQEELIKVNKVTLRDSTYSDRKPTRIQIQT